MSEPREAKVSIQYNGKNVTSKLNEFIKSFNYTDVASGESDSISLSLTNIDKRWFNQWLPEKGDSMKANIITKNWLKDGDSNTFKCGSFTIDDYNFGGWPSEVEIGAVSIPATESFKVTKRTKTWNSATIKSIASEIAKRAKVSFFYEGPSIKINTIEQSNQSDCEFLFRLCETYGLAMKMYANKIVIFDEADYEKKQHVATIDMADVDSWSFNTTLAKSYTGAEITYSDGIKGEEYKVKVGTGNRILKINEKVDSIRDAEIKALARLHYENKKMTTMKITMKANPKIIASSNILIKGLGRLDGKYAVDKVGHTIGRGYTMQIDLRLISFSSDSDNKAKSSKGIKYTVKKGDTLWAISKKFLNTGAKYMEIYRANKDIIENAAKAHGKANSDNGNRIYPGTVLTIPE